MASWDAHTAVFGINHIYINIYNSLININYSYSFFCPSIYLVIFISHVLSPAGTGSPSTSPGTFIGGALVVRDALLLAAPSESVLHNNKLNFDLVT